MSSNTLRGFNNVRQPLIFARYLETQTPAVPKAKKAKIKQTAPPKVAFTADSLVQIFRNPLHIVPSTAHLNIASLFFNTTAYKLEWSSAKFTDIPGEAARLEHEKLYEEQSQRMAEQEMEDERLGREPSNNTNQKNDKSSTAKRKFEKTGISWSILKPLPEVAFLGKCNVGKSSLINALITPKSRLKNIQYSRVSKTAGFTRTLNCFNFGNSLRIIDTPGYGVKGRSEQGEQIMDYLQKRKQLKRVFLLIAIKHEFSSEDRAIMELLTENGIPFEIIFTKVDRMIKKIKDSEKIITKMEKLIEKEGLKDHPMVPKLLFCNGETSNTIKLRYGVSEIRLAILEACGYTSSSQPVYKRRDKDI